MSLPLLKVDFFLHGGVLSGKKKGVRKVLVMYRGYKIVGDPCVPALCCSGALESAAGVCVVGLHQPSAEEGRSGDREGDQDQ